MKKMTRRQFLKTTALAGAGGMLLLKSPSALAGMMGGGGMGGGGMGGSGTTVIDPPPGSPFLDPPLAPRFLDESGIPEFRVTALESGNFIGNTPARLLTYNGLNPGPVIRAASGETIRVRFANSLPELGTNILGHDRTPTNLHTHGLHVSPMGNSDNVMLMFMPGDEFLFEYDLSLQAPGTLNFYHPHVHGSVAEQYWAGLAGPLVIEDPPGLLPPFETHLFMVRDIALSGGYPAPHDSMMDFMHGLEGPNVLVNGQVNPVLPIRPGQVQRWRVLNACTARFLKLSLEGHSLQVIGTDGGLLDKPYPASYVILSPGERVDLLVKAVQSQGTYRLLSLPYSRGGMSGSQQVTLTTVTYKGSRTTDSIPAVIDPWARRESATPAATRRLVLSMGQGRGYINGISWGEMGGYEIHSMLDTWEVWEVVNQSGMDHPFHQHVNPCQVISITGGDPAYASLLLKAPAWKDTVLIPKWGSAKLLIPVMDFEGMAMFHCHITEHEDIGMMGAWHIMGMPM